MLTADQIEAIGDQAQQLLSPVVEYLIEDIAKRISEAGQLTSTAAYQTWRIQQLGVSQRQLKKELRKLLKVSHRDLRRLLEQSAEAGYDYDIRKHPYVQALSFRENALIQNIVSAAVQLAEDDLRYPQERRTTLPPSARLPGIFPIMGSSPSTMIPGYIPLWKPQCGAASWEALA